VGARQGLDEAGRVGQPRAPVRPDQRVARGGREEARRTPPLAMVTIAAILIWL
jgi:hypothetical protein